MLWHVYDRSWRHDKVSWHGYDVKCQSKVVNAKLQLVSERFYTVVLVLFFFISESFSLLCNYLDWHLKKKKRPRRAGPFKYSLAPLTNVEGEQFNSFLLDHFASPSTLASLSESVSPIDLLTRDTNEPGNQTRRLLIGDMRVTASYISQHLSLRRLFTHSE